MIVRKIHLPFGDIAAFETFINDIRFRNRFTQSKSARYLISELTEFARWRQSYVLSAGQVFYRARIHPFGPEDLSFDPLPREEMAAPPPAKPKEAPQFRRYSVFVCSY
jgi:hypothetical protein